MFLFSFSPPHARTQASRVQCSAVSSAGGLPAGRLIRHLAPACRSCTRASSQPTRYLPWLTYLPTYLPTYLAVFTNSCGLAEASANDGFQLPELVSKGPR